MNKLTKACRFPLRKSTRTCRNPTSCRYGDSASFGVTDIQSCGNSKPSTKIRIYTKLTRPFTENFPIMSGEIPEIKGEVTVKDHVGSSKDTTAQHFWRIWDFLTVAQRTSDKFSTDGTWIATITISDNIVTVKEAEKIK